ncbi:MAG: alanine racemase [Tissierellia bacterium]|nr:alanine racemase [Tissierellia bacterium]
MRATRAVIDLNKLAHNAKLLSQKAQGREVMCIIKADAYGHGAVPVLHSLVEQGFYYFGVATLEEALELRRANREISILILGGISPEDIPLAYENQIHVAIHNLASLEVMENHGLRGLCHIKIDTGMHRVGFLPNDLPALAKRIVAIKPVGVFTHLARADEADKTSALKQVEAFRQAVVILESAGAEFEHVHFANSAAILGLDLSFSTLVRAGIALYGLNPSPEVTDRGLQPVMQLVSAISDIREIEELEGVSYSHRFVAEKQTRVATIPVGYADGYKRNMSTKVMVWINGELRPQIGRITMDQTMIDVTGLAVGVGDEVELMGRHVTADDLAVAADTINYEIVTNIGKRVRREYLERSHDAI